MNSFLHNFQKMGLKGFLLSNLGIICCAISTTLFITPAKLIVGGASGLSVFLAIITNFADRYYIYLYGINFLLIVLSFFTLGKNYTLKTIYGSIMLPTYGFIISAIIKHSNFPLTQIISEVEPIFIVLAASFLMGFGIGINMKLGGSTGGFDILESVFLKYFHIPYSTSIYILDCILVVLGMAFYSPGEFYVFKNWLSEGLGATMYIVLLGIIVDVITFGGYNKRAVFIRSEKYQEIHDTIIHKLVRGLTYINAEGGYSETPTKMIVCICYSKEYFILRDMIQKIDPNAFIFVTKATEVRGLGFNFETKEYVKYRNEKIKRKEKTNDL
ncbi:MAG: YitT family protein [Erysipelotrichaceae bacterium]|nr:YitT family protein [Erysipelotrichaceae bacterium]